jgi:hypothetical protein
MPSSRKFYRTVFTVEVLSEEEPEPVDLEVLNQQITDGPWSGVVTKGKSEEIGGARMAELLQEQGSDPGFFELTDDGEDV